MERLSAFVLALLLTSAAHAAPPAVGTTRVSVYSTASQSCGGVPCVWADSASGKVKIRDAAGVDKVSGEADRFTAAASDPASPVFGQCIANSSSGKVRCYQGGAWVSWGDGGTASAIGFAAVQTALAAASSSVSLNSQKITSVADPTSAQDAATKTYADKRYNFHGAASSALATQYLGPAASTASATEVALFTAPETLTVAKLVCTAGTAPGGIVSDTLSIISKASGGSWGGLATTCVITGSSKTCSSSLTASLAQYDAVGIKIVRDALSVGADYNCEVRITQ